MWLGGGTSFSLPQVGGEAALLIAYAKSEGINLDPSDLKKAIMEGAIPIEGYEEFEQGAGYINCVNSLDVIKTMAEAVRRVPEELGRDAKGTGGV